jgi:hypothetical protein
LPVVFVANSGEDTVSVICPRRLREIHRYRLASSNGPRGPRRLAADADALFIAASFSSQLLRLGIANGSLDALSVGRYPTGLCLQGARVFVSCGESDSIWKVTRDSFTPSGCFPAGAFPNSVEPCPGRRLLAACVSGAEAVLLDAVNGEVLRRISTGGPAYFAGFHTSGSIWCACQCAPEDEQGCIIVYAPDGTQAGLVKAGIMPGPVRFFDGGSKAAVSDTSGRGLCIVDCESLGVKVRTGFPGMVDDIAVLGDDGFILVSSMEEGVVERVDFSGKKAGRVAVGREPRGLAVTAG